jgi:tetratricopeptide (TPR) repeat protein
VPDVERVLRPLGYERASGEIERRRTFEAVASFLGGIARQRPLLVTLDDLHNAGASTVELLHFTLRWDHAAPLLVVATVRHDEAAEVLDQLGPLSSRVDVGPLAEDAVVALAGAAGLADQADTIMNMTRGHTLFVVEVLRALVDPSGAPAGSEELRVPESLRSAVQARVQRCGKGVEEFLAAAAVAGPSFELENIADMLSVSPEDAARWADRARRAGVLVESGTGYEFANELIRETLYQAIPAPSRLLRHRRLSALLADRPEAAAGHAAAAGDWAVAAARGLEAGNRALAAFANREAEQIFTSALSACALLDDPSLTANAQLGRGRARVARGNYTAAIEDFAAAQQLARIAGLPAIEAAALVDLGWCTYYARDLSRANELAARAAAHPAAGPRAEVLVGRMRNTTGDLSGAIAVLEPLARGDADAATRAYALSSLGTALAHSDRYEDATGVLAEAITACRHTGVLRGLLNARFFGCLVRANLGDLGAALTSADELLADVERYDASSYRPRALNLLAWIWRELGDLPRARDLAQEALERCEIGSGEVEGEPAANALLALAESALLDGDDVDARRWLGEIDPLLSDRVGYRWRIELRRLELLVRLGSSPAEELVDLARRRGSAKYEALGLGYLTRLGEAAEVADRTGSLAILARVAPAPIARQSFEALADRLPDDLRNRFVTAGLLARQLAHS